MSAPFPYVGPEPLRPVIAAALQRVVDPELALSIVDVGLVYGVTVADTRVHVLMTMTSAACPVTDLIIEDVEAELERVVPEGHAIDIELTWVPAWSTERLSARAKLVMGW